MRRKTRRRNNSRGRGLTGERGWRGKAREEDNGQPEKEQNSKEENRMIKTFLLEVLT